MLDVLGEYPEAVEADLMHHYSPRDPVAEFWQGRITLRKLRVMVEGLPPSGALARAVAGHHWTQADYHRADELDLLARLVTDFANVNRTEQTPPSPYPPHVWRPGDPLPEVTAAAEETARAEARAGYEHINAQVLPGKR